MAEPPPPPGVPGRPGAGAADDVPAADLVAGALDFEAAGADDPPDAPVGAAVVPAAAGAAASVAGVASVGAAGVSAAGEPESGATAWVSAGFGRAELECF